MGHNSQEIQRNGEKTNFSHADSATLLDLREGVALPETFRQGVRSKRVEVFLDYDGTLVPLEEEPKEAVLNESDAKLLKEMSRLIGVHFVIVSGREADFLHEQLKGLRVAIAAEHGARYYDPQRKRWRTLVRSRRDQWYSTALRMMEDYQKGVPGSFIEKKRYGVSWHYRQSPKKFAAYQARKLREELEGGFSNLPVTILAGKKVVEARAAEANKGAFLRWYLSAAEEERPQPFVLSIGDDQTDEDLFACTPEKGATIKVGRGRTQALYRLERQRDLKHFLQRLRFLRKH